MQMWPETEWKCSFNALKGAQLDVHIFSKNIVIDKATRWRHVCDVFDPLDIDLSQLITNF